MVRGKVQMKKIEDATSRQVTFSKRRNGLLKKAYELSVLCDAQVAVIVFSQNGRLYEFSSSDMSKILERYREYTKDVTTNKFGDDYIQQQLKLESANMAEKIQLLEISKSSCLKCAALASAVLGSSFEIELIVSCCSYDELKEIEDQLQRSLLRVRQRKAQLYMEQIDQLRCQESNLLLENAKLTEMVVVTHYRRHVGGLFKGCSYVTFLLLAGKILVFRFTLPPLSTLPPPRTFTSPISLKLNEDNFLVWKHQALATVTGLHLMKFLESSSYPPKYVTLDAAASDTVNPLYLHHLQQD
ncbi:hypothetical protein V8G54_028294 [Vigna mungo]|uniref:Uncharacterized protein n=1 Tax=Vigna mungo TaxID=3915 RepID=A0AAQ3MSI2_VIGMU